MRAWCERSDFIVVDDGKCGIEQMAGTNKKMNVEKKKWEFSAMLNTHAKTEAKCIFVVLKLYCCYCLEDSANELWKLRGNHERWNGFFVSLDVVFVTR